eukprot:TRINITY_DN16243_c1_g1_i5.p1 TRINITY_DN16243_c1_g1~~TRINITY_DN16243_c1_g1_i5.p1  ORF type:complete len:781 (-),score=106.98 TRINITY_DN16243_c1_g1_i5:171-2513(-)
MLCTEVEYVKEEDRLNEQFETWMETFVERANAVLDDVVRGKVDDCIQKRLLEGPTHAQKHASVSEPADDLIKKCLEALDALIDDKLSTREEVTVSTSGVTLVDGEESNPTIVPMTVGHSLGGCDVRHRSFLGGVNSARSARASQASEVEQEYRLSASVWDASLFFFVGGLSSWDRFLIGFGFAMNLVIQSVMVWALVTNMSDLDFDADSILRKLEWRVERGHAYTSMDVVTGTTMLTKLCERSLWSFEQEEYKQIYDYLYRPVPGIYLTLLAVLLWVMSTLGEFRLTLEKALALIAIPVVPQGAETLQCLNSQYEVVGWRKCHQISAIIVMLIPRCVILVVLCWAGCKYLAQIVTLSDIVLNACGLAFVLDIDEMSAAVFLPCSVLVTLARTRSMKYGKPYTVGEHIVLKHVVRLLLFVCITVTVFLVYAVPFKECIKASEEALCAGVRNFTFEGGTPSNIPVIIKEASVTEPCHGKIAQDYFEQNFPGNRTSDAWDNATPLSTEVKTDAEFIAQRLSAVLSVVYRDCGKWGYTDEYSCKPVTVMVQEALIKLNMTPERQPLANCPRIAISRITNCDFEPPGMPEICRYSVLAQECEGASPGVAMMLCNADLWRSCEAWKRIGLAHPTRNCLIAETCPPGHNCIAAIGNVILRVSNLDLDAASFDQNFKENLRELLVPGFQEAFYELCELLDHTTEELSKELPEVNFRPDDMRLLAGSTNQTVIKLTYYVYPVPDVVVEGFLQRVKFQEAVMNHTTAALETSDGVKVMELTISEPVFQKG